MAKPKSFCFEHPLGRDTLELGTCGSRDFKGLPVPYEGSECSGKLREALNDQKEEGDELEGDGLGREGGLYFGLTVQANKLAVWLLADIEHGIGAGRELSHEHPEFEPEV